MNTKIQETLDCMDQLSPPGHFDRNNHQAILLYQTKNLARIYALVADEQTKSALLMETHTRKIIRLTKWLVALTVALLLFTVYLAYNVYSDHHAPCQRDSSEEKRRPAQQLAWIQYPCVGANHGIESLHCGGHESR